MGPQMNVYSYIHAVYMYLPVVVFRLSGKVSSPIIPGRIISRPQTRSVKEQRCKHSYNTATAKRDVPGAGLLEQQREDKMGAALRQ